MSVSILVFNIRKVSVLKLISEFHKNIEYHIEVNLRYKTTILSFFKNDCIFKFSYLILYSKVFMNIIIL